jgi:hypothetical protein
MKLVCFFRNAVASRAVSDPGSLPYDVKLVERESASQAAISAFMLASF